MLTFNPSSLRPSLGDAAANPATGGASSSGSPDPAGFASLLRQTQRPPMPMPPPPMPAPSAAPAPKSPGDKGATTEPVSSNESPDEAPAPQEPESTSRARELQKIRLRAANGAAVSGREGKPTLDTPDTRTTRDTRDTKDPATACIAPGGDCLAPETKLTAAGAPMDPSVMQWLADLQRAAVPTGGAKGGSADGTVEDPGTTAAALAESSGATKPLRAADLKADAELKDKAAQAKAQLADAADAVNASPFAAALKEQGSIEKPAFKAIDTTRDVAALGASAQAAAPATGTQAAAPVAVPIATPVTAPDFAQELGLRLSLLAKDGVQTAELHLNPADMGPVSVQIVMDGTQARVDFGADMAATRQAIEAGLPELASALRDAGFTLAGGGVSQHAGGRSGGGAGDGAGSDSSNHGDARRSLPPDQVQRVATAARRIVRQGGVDLFA